MGMYTDLTCKRESHIVSVSATNHNWLQLGKLQLMFINIVKTYTYQNIQKHYYAYNRAVHEQGDINSAT